MMTPAEISSRYRLRHPDRVRATKKAWREAHKAEITSYKHRYRELNIDRAKQLDKESYLRRREVIIAQKRSGYALVGEKVRLCMRRRYAKDPVARCAATRKWQLKNPGKVNANVARRRAAKIQATPPWLTADQFKQMAQFYIEAHRLEQIDGIARHVDHIYPLRGKTVSGLHVPWNLRILTSTDNLSKGNR